MSCPGTSCLFPGMCWEEPAWTGYLVASHGNQRPVQEKGKVRILKENTACWKASTKVMVIVTAVLSSGNHSVLRAAMASHCLRAALLGKKHPCLSKISQLLLGVPFKILNRCRLFLCSFNAYIPSPSFVRGVMQGFENMGFNNPSLILWMSK